MPRIVQCAGGVVLDDAGRLLLIRRANAPGRGLWSVPGGRCEPGESLVDACVREVEEETGLRVRVGTALGQVEVAGVGDEVYEITDFRCDLVDGSLRAGDDAGEVRWVTLAEFRSLPLVGGLAEFLDGHGMLPR